MARGKRSADLVVVLGTVFALSGCAPKEIAYQISVATQSCDALNQPLEGVQFLMFRVTGEGIDRPPEAIAAASAKRLELPGIPAGANRVIEVRGYDGDPKSGGRVVSMGRSVALDIPTEVPVRSPPSITVFLRRVNAFSAPVNREDSRCLTMKVARAGHTATRLKNGKVFIAGGFRLREGTLDRVALADAEVFDPATATFEAARDVSLNQGGITSKLERAYQSATLLPSSGQVALWGGEVYPPDGGAAVALSSVIFYDPDVDDYGTLPVREHSPLPRAHHGAAVSASGRLLVAAGLGDSGRAQGAVEWFDPSTTEYGAVQGVDLPRVDATVATVQKGALVVVAGGTDGSSMIRDVALFQLIGGTFVPKRSPTISEPGRRSAAGAALREGSDLILLGGYSDPVHLKSLASSEIVSGEGATVTSGPNVVSMGEVCAVTLSDGRVMAIGGRTADESGGFPSSGGQTVLVTATAQGSVSSLGGPDLPVPRFGHTCTALLDGTVLVTGGIDENGSQEILSDVWIYQPAPLD